MTTAFQNPAPEFKSVSDKKSIAWGLSLAVVLAFAIIFMLRSISKEHIVPASVTGSGRTENSKSDSIPSTAPTDTTQPSK